MASLPNAPNITIRPDARDQALKFFWSAPTPNGSPPVLSYQLTDGATNTISLPAVTTFYTYSGLTNGTAYTFRIAASNAVGLGPYAFYRTVQPGLTPGIPTLSTVISTTGSLNYTVGWSNPSNLGGATNLLGTLLTAYPLDSNGNLITTSSLLIQRTVIGGNSNAFQQALVPLTSNYDYKVLISPVVDAGYGRNQLFTSTISSSTVTPVVIAFSPSSITGMQLWLDANDSGSIVQVGPRVSQWNDKSGNGKTFSNSTSNDSPTYDSVAKQLFFSSNALNASSIILTNQRNLNFFAVWSVSTTTGATFQAVFEQNALTNSNGYRFMVYGSPFDSRSGNFYGLNGYGTNPTPTLGFPAFTVNSTMMSFIGAQSDGTTFTVNNRHNGALYSTQTISQANFNVASATTRLGRRVGGTEEPFYGKLAEILLYSSVLGVNQYQVLEGYLAWKWGLSTLLPSFHPFYTRQPLPTDSNLDFSPSSLGGTQVWLDAADATTIVRSGSTSTIVTWNDKSGLANNATAVNNPVYVPTDSSVYLNNASSQYFTFANGVFPFSNSSYSYYMTVQFSTFTDRLNVGLVGGGTANVTNNSFNLRGSGDGGRITTYWWNNDLTNVNTFSLNQKTTVATYYSTNSTRNILLNYQSTATDTPGIRSQPNTSNTLGRTLASEYLFGRIHEFLVYSTVHSQTDRQRIEGYLAWKWGNQSFLPPTHLYFNRAPTRLDTFTSFSPSSITGLRVWIDAADATIVTLSSTSMYVSSIRDKSSNAYQFIGANGFTYNSTTKFNTTFPSFYNDSFNNQRHLGSNMQVSINQPLTFFMVGQCTDFSTGNNNAFDSQTGANRVSFGKFGTTNYGSMFAGSEIFSSINFHSTPHLVTAYFSTTNSFEFVNGSATPYVAGTVGTSNLSTLLLANRFLSGGINAAWQGHICEMMWFAGPLLTADRQRVEGYLAWKWGLQSNLPDTHPYRFGSTISLGPISS